MANAYCPATGARKYCSSRISAIRRSPMTIPAAWPLRPSLRPGWPPPHAAIVIVLCLRPEPLGHCAGSSAMNTASVVFGTVWCSGDWGGDRVVEYVTRAGDARSRVIAFEPYGYDERQLCSPGFNLPVGRLTRSVNDGYPEYHSSADDLALMSAERLEQSLEACKQVVQVLESNRRYINLSPKGEP